MTTVKMMDDLLERKIGHAQEVSSRDLRIESDEEFFLLINAMARMAENAPDCPYSIEQFLQPSEVRVGKWWVPNCRIARKRVFMGYDPSDRRLVGDKRRYYDAEEKVFFA